MALTADELATVRVEISDATPPTDADLDAIHDRVLTVKATILAVLKKRLAAYIADPGQFIIPGEYGQNTAKNIEALERQIARVQRGDYGETSSTSTGRVILLRRADVR